MTSNGDFTMGVEKVIVSDYRYFFRPQKDTKGVWNKGAMWFFNHGLTGI
jgi:hypothetical protein